jgi:hypothetical protein
VGVVLLPHTGTPTGRATGRTSHNPTDDHTRRPRPTPRNPVTPSSDCRRPPVVHFCVPHSSLSCSLSPSPCQDLRIRGLRCPAAIRLPSIPPPRPATPLFTTIHLQGRHHAAASTEHNSRLHPHQQRSSPPPCLAAMRACRQPRRRQPSRTMASWRTRPTAATSAWRSPRSRS